MIFLNKNKIDKSDIIKRSLFDVVAHHWMAKIGAFLLAVLLFILRYMSNMQERDFNIPVNVVLNQQVALVDINVPRVRLVVRGLQQELDRLSVNDFEVYVEALDALGSGDKTYALQVRRNTNILENESLSFKLYPQTATIRYEPKVIKELGIKVLTIGQAPPNYTVLTRAMPASIIVHGPQSLLETLKFIETYPITIDGHNQAFNTTAKLQHDNYLHLPYGEICDVSINFQPIPESSVQYTLVPDPVGLQAGLHLETHLDSVIITISGNASDLQLFDTTSIRLSLDLSDIQEEGQYSVPIKFYHINAPHLTFKLDTTDVVLEIKPDK
jgi:YbbR domain-containing protein